MSYLITVLAFVGCIVAVVALIRSHHSKPQAKPSSVAFSPKLLLLPVAVCGVTAICLGSRASFNSIQSMGNAQLQAAANKRIDFDHRSHGITVSTYYRGAFDRSTVVFDLKGLSGRNSRLDVFRVFLDFAEQLKHERCDTVELAYESQTKFRIDGAYFQQLGEERSYQNPTYTVRTFPQHLKTPTGQSAYSTWEGGILGVLQRQMEDFNDFHDKWYLDEMLH